MEETMDYPHFTPCPACGAKTSTVTKSRPCSVCGCTVDDPHGVLSDAGHSGAERTKAEDESPPTTEWTAHEFRELCKRRKLARQYARKAEEPLLYDELSCPKCSSTRLQSLPKDGGLLWRLSCRACGQAVVSAALDKALVQIEHFSAYESQFLKANPTEKEAPMYDAPMVTLERALKDKAVEELRSSRKMVEVFPEKQLSSVLEGAGISGDGDERSRIRQTMKRIMESSGFRPIAVPGPAWQGEIEELQEHFPNFASAISDVILPSLAITSAGGRARPAPLLLVGSPGVGKSYFAEMLSKMLGVPRAKVDMASATMGAGIGGLCSHWGNAGPGEVFKILAFGRGGAEAVANPLIFLDEIDKVGPDLRYDPLGPLYSLLELESARKFEDESLPGLEIDTSHIRWIMCANKTSPIPGPILSRVHVVHVREPTESELKNIRTRIFSGVVKGIGISDFENWIPPSILNRVREYGAARV